VGIALATGRIGCFVRGCCAGRLADVPWAMSLPVGSEAHVNHGLRGLVTEDAAASLPIHPLPIYLALAGVVTTLGVVWLARRKHYAGEPAIAMVALLGLATALAETFRETELVAPVPLRTMIPAALGLLALLALAATRVHRHERARPAARLRQV
jgi:phosphatidylglycerol:prolipoprotein diacylglycerol transferase